MNKNKYMNSMKGLITVALFIATVFVVDAQNTPVRTRSNENKTNSTNMSVRAQSLYEKSEVSAADVPWMRIIYRQIDLTKEKNLPLYYPEESTEAQENMFRMIMKLVTDSKIPAYEYLDGRELFTDQYKLKVKDMLDRFQILYQEKQGLSAKSTQYLMEDSDIPANEVLSYYIREKWMFDQRKSGFYATIEAICPVLHRAGDFGGDTLKYPMFWIQYESLRPYLAQQYIMTSSENNVSHYSFDDYFQLRMFDGEIYKTANLRNMSLMQMYPGDSAITKARNSIENKLQTFEESLWVKAPEPTTTSAKESKASKKGDAAPVEMAVQEPSSATKETTRSTRSSRGVKKEKTAKVKTSSTKSSSSSKSSPVRSVRRTR